MADKKSKWVICSVCEGEGKHSRALGCFTWDEMQEQFDDEGREDYFRGAYDRSCADCNGTGKVLEEELTEEEEQERSDAYWESYGERRMGA